jgi:hypothetical protein
LVLAGRHQVAIRAQHALLADLDVIVVLGAIDLAQAAAIGLRR